MTSREKEILDLIKTNPMIAQQEIADKLKITRSSAAVHITNLMKKGYIAGKGYIVSNDEYALVLGGANIDIQGFTDNTLIYRDSNPGRVKLSLGGVGRNIAENMSKLGIRTKLISTLGDDIYGSKIIDDCKAIGIDTEDCIVYKGATTSTYLSILNHKGDMEVAVSDMDIINKLTIEIIKKKSHILQNARAIVMDTNLNAELLYYIATEYKNKAMFLDTVSTTKAKKVKDFIGMFHTIKPNRIEAELLSDIKLSSEKDLEKAGEYFLSKGVKNVFISLGSDGVYFSDGYVSGVHKAPDIEVINATGAGDAFMAAIIYGYINEMGIKEAAIFGIAAAAMALSHENTINPMLSIDNIEKIVKEM